MLKLIPQALFLELLAFTNQMVTTNATVDLRKLKNPLVHSNCFKNAKLNNFKGQCSKYNTMRIIHYAQILINHQCLGLIIIIEPHESTCDMFTRESCYVRKQSNLILEVT